MPERTGASGTGTSTRRSGTAAGGWGTLVNLGNAVNTEAAEAGASFSPDGKYLFFSRAGDICWVSAKILEALAAKDAPDKAPTTDSREY